MQYTFKLPESARITGREISLDLPIIDDPTLYSDLRRRMKEAGVQAETIEITLAALERATVSFALVEAFNL